MTHQEKANELIKTYGKELAQKVANECYFAIYNYLKDTDELQGADREFAWWNQVEENIKQLK